MPIELLPAELGESASIAEQGRDRVRYILRGTTSRIAACVYATANVPMISERGLPLVGLEINKSNLSAWEVIAEYSTQQGAERPRPPGTIDFSFEIGTKSERITQSLSTVKFGSSEYIEGFDTPDFHGAIGVTGDRIEGVDVNVPTFCWVEKHIVPLDQLYDTSFQDDLYTICHSPLNNATFRRKPAGEVMFLGASGSQRGFEDAEIVYRFASQKNLTGLTIGSVTGIAKGGWDYAWILWEDVADDAAQWVVKKPRGVYVETVYRRSNFNGLRIGE